jgi:hypothetical protein
MGMIYKRGEILWVKYYSAGRPIRSRCRRGSGGKGCCQREKAKWTAAGAGEEVGFLYCAGVRPDGVAGWRPRHFSAQRGH